VAVSGSGEVIQGLFFTIKKEDLLTVFVHDIAFRGNVYK